MQVAKTLILKSEKNGNPCNILENCLVRLSSLIFCEANTSKLRNSSIGYGKKESNCQCVLTTFG